VSGVFDVREMRPSLRTLLCELAIEPLDDTLIIRRKIARNDRNKILVNQVPLPLAALKKLGDCLVDLHGQHEHQSLLSEETHGAVIDDLPKVREVKDRYTAAYATYATSKSEADAFEAKASALAERKEVLEFHYKELADLDLRPAEEDELQGELTLLSSSAERRAAASEILSQLTASQDSIEKQVALVRRKLETLAKFDASVQPWVIDVENALAVFTELETFCGAYLSRIGGGFKRSAHRAPQFPARKNPAAEERNTPVRSTNLSSKRDALKNDLSSIVNIDADRVLAKKLAAALAACKQAGAALRAARKKAALEFDKKVSDLMEQLGFNGGLWQTGFLCHDDPRPVRARRGAFHGANQPRRADVAACQNRVGRRDFPPHARNKNRHVGP
jgi:DNA repair protein RecN (Recombination protein N)